MADTSKTRPGKNGGKSTAHTAVSRRAELRKSIPKRDSVWRRWIAHPELTASVPIALAFVVIAGILTAWTREQLLVAPDRIMTSTRLVRSEFRVEDTAAGETKRRAARQNTPRVYNADQAVFNAFESALLRLPTALADVATLDDVAPEIRKTFQLAEAELAALRTQAVAGDASQEWRTHVESLIDLLHSSPLLDNETFQLEQTNGSRQWVDVRADSREPAKLLKGRLVNLDSAQLSNVLRQAVLQSGFEGPVASMITGYLSRNHTPTFTFDPAATLESQSAAAAAVETDYITYPAGHVIYQRGERLTLEELGLLRAERASFVRSAPHGRLWTPRIAALSMALLVTIGLWLYITAFCKQIRRNPLRVVTVAILLLAGLALACVGAIENPALLTLASTAPAVFITGILVIAYDRATALAVGSLFAALVVIALHLSAAAYLPALGGVIAVAWGLDDVRHRNDLVHTGLASGLTMAFAVAAVALLERPTSPGLWREVLIDAGWQLGAGLSIGVVILAMLPTIERVFDIITGMTLIELRDPKQPLLRLLQQRAPGTYNHSLGVANIAENAAEAIHARSLHLYVGALYHDIGKMNKPDYFIENQSGGPNRHDKLTPAMSLLVILGHVKDGVELAREYNLPRALHHYIESHHGVTLVEYFYHEAQRQAEESQTDPPNEVAYRYPGPKPRTKEAAILMLSDSVESATRALKEPAPARIETLVRSIARARLRDGQFDNCDLTLRELHTIEESIIKSVNSIYHARIAYPGGESKGEPKSNAKPPTESAGSPPPVNNAADPSDTGSPMEKTISQSA